jgi:transcriptional regulator with XRE-family HTH domain
MDKSWLQERLAEKKISQRKLSALLGLDQGSMSRTINGKRRLQVSEAAEISLIFGESLDEVLSRFGVIEDHARVNIKISGVIGSDGKMAVIEEPVSVAPPKSAIGELACVQIRCDHPLDRAIIFFGDPVMVVTDRLAMLLLPNDVVVVGVASKGYLPGKYRIRTLFGNVIEDTDILSAKVVADITPL